MNSGTSHVKLHEYLQITTKKDNDFNRIQKKIYIFSVKWNKTLTIHQEISYNHVKNISIHLKYLNIYEKKQKISLFRKYFINTHQEHEKFNYIQPKFIIIDTFTKNHHKDVSQHDKFHTKYLTYM